MGMKDLLFKPLRFYYNGYSTSLFKSITGGAIYFPLKDLLQRETGNNIIASIGSAFIPITLCQPVDWLKTRLMNSQVVTIKDLRHSYTGYGLNLCRIVPHFTIVICLVDHINAK